MVSWIQNLLWVVLDSNVRKGQTHTGLSKICNIGGHKLFVSTWLQIVAIDNKPDKTQFGQASPSIEAAKFFNWLKYIDING